MTLTLRFLHAEIGHSSNGRLANPTFSWFVPSMATKKQVDANRGNAAKSTGPKTAAGKAVSSQNARTHGVLSQHAISDRESQEAFDELLEQLVCELNPETALECTLVERLAIAGAEKRTA